MILYQHTHFIEIHVVENHLTPRHILHGISLIRVQSRKAFITTTNKVDALSRTKPFNVLDNTGELFVTARLVALGKCRNELVLLSKPERTKVDSVLLPMMRVTLERQRVVKFMIPSDQS